MVQKNRAWRRRKARTMMAKVKATKEWVMRQLANPEPKSKPYQAQKLRSRNRLDQELRDALVA